MSQVVSTQTTRVPLKQDDGGLELLDFIDPHRDAASSLHSYAQQHAVLLVGIKISHVSRIIWRAGPHYE